VEVLADRGTVPDFFAALLFSASFLTTSGPAASSLVAKISTATAASEAAGAGVAWAGAEKVGETVKVLGPVANVGW